MDTVYLQVNGINMLKRHILKIFHKQQTIYLLVILLLLMRKIFLTLIFSWLDFLVSLSASQEYLKRIALDGNMAFKIRLKVHYFLMLLE